MNCDSLQAPFREIQHGAEMDATIYPSWEGVEYDWTGAKPKAIDHGT